MTYRIGTKNVSRNYAAHRLHWKYRTLYVPVENEDDA